MTSRTPDVPRPGGPSSGTPTARRRRPRPRTLAPLAVAAWAVLEIWLLTVVADATGGWLVAVLLLAALVLGVVVIRRAGRRAWQRLTESLRAGVPPDPAADRGGSGTAVTMLGGLLLVLPGLLSDVAGLLLLFPPTARLLRRAAVRAVSRHATLAPPGTWGDALRQARAAGEQVRIHRPDGKVVPGEVIRDETGDDRDEGPSAGR